jgi:hypothetical protein
MTVRGKFEVQKVAKLSYGGSEITLSPHYDTSIEEDRRYAKATPSATITMYVNNPPAEAVLALGKFFYVDFTPIEV